MKYLKTFNEARKEIKGNDSDIGLFIYENSLTLYNPKTDEVIAYSGISQTYDDTNILSTVAAVKGYGPLIYELSIMYSGNNGLMLTRSGDVRGVAFDVWEKFYDSGRIDIKKETLPIEDDKFNFSILTGEENVIYDNLKDKMEEYENYLENGDFFDNKKAILVYNTKLFMNKNDTYYRLVSIANDWINKGVDLKTVDDKGNDFFNYRYNE